MVDHIVAKLNFLNIIIHRDKERLDNMEFHSEVFSKSFCTSD